MLDLVPGLHDYLSNPANKDSFIWMPLVDHSPAAHKLSLLVPSLSYTCVLEAAYRWEEAGLGSESRDQGPGA